MRYLTAGESHCKGLTTIVEGFPSNVEILPEDINAELKRRQKGYGRGGRMQIESDNADILSGIRHGKTLGSPIALNIYNKDWENWTEIMSITPVEKDFSPITSVRPGHADLPGMIKYNQNDLRNILERSSARETAARVAAGSIAKTYLKNFNISIWSHVTTIGSAEIKGIDSNTIKYNDVKNIIEESELSCIDKNAEKLMIKEINKGKDNGVSLGGIFEVCIDGLPVGLGSHVQWDRKLDANISHAVMSIQAIKGIEFGAGFKAAEQTGEKIHDEIFYDDSRGYYRKTNNAGGIEGGMSNGERVVVRAAMKPIPTMKHALKSVDINTHKNIDAHFERADNCAVPAASVVAENAIAFVIAKAINEKLGGDSIEEQIERFKSLKSQ